MTLSIIVYDRSSVVINNYCYQSLRMLASAMEKRGAKGPMVPIFLDWPPPWPPSFGHKRHQNADVPQNITNISLAPPALSLIIQ